MSRWSCDQGTFTAAMGPSGSGKTTLLHCAAGMDRPNRGSVWWADTEISRLPERHLAVRRRNRVGFVFQDFNLIPSMTIVQNVARPSRVAGTRIDQALVRQALEHVGLADRARRRPVGARVRHRAAHAALGHPDHGGVDVGEHLIGQPRRAVWSPPLRQRGVLTGPGIHQVPVHEHPVGVLWESPRRIGRSMLRGRLFTRGYGVTAGAIM